MEIKTICTLILLFFSFTTNADSNFSDPNIIAEGGRLYDKWWAEYDLRKPSSTHSAYTSLGKKSGANTWRCKECHGWDYRGSKGAYAKGSHFTGITGLTKVKHKSIDEIVTILKDKTHHYNDVMLDFALKRIANFIKRGQVDISPHLNKQTKHVNGDIRRGKHFFNKSCKECHGSDGRDRNFKNDNNPEYIGTISIKNPWETIHKIRNGHPGAYVMGEPMPNMNGKLSLSEQIDLLTYMQSLPIK